MTQQALCFDTFTRICQCSSLPNLNVPKLPEKPLPVTTPITIITKVLEGINPNGEVDTLQDDDNKSTIAIIIGCILAVILICTVAGVIYIYIKKRGSYRMTQQNNSQNQT